ncbi:hypothetical protein AAFF_G00286880 [Aldrovandia affinis]|uniref:Uncharacterized protein n=1 Tax=Aldrovandia affinis TaxID=143900 RepID=A0AAD7X1A4_9TELE|nr:hypothetical protein AAFF_G00286880 [Aldrovandia affinis]
MKKEEALDGYADSADALTSGTLAEELRKASGARARLREATARMAVEAGMRPSAFVLFGTGRASGVDTGSTVTLVRPDLVPGWTQFEPTTVQLRTVTGELAPMKGRGVLTLTVGGRTVCHPVWIAAVQDPCILGLDFLRATGCQLDLEKGTLCFQGGSAVTMGPLMFQSHRPPDS